MKTKKSKIYENFQDKFGNVYKFSNYLDFARFWFSASRRTNLNYFPDNFKKLQAAATTSNAETLAIIKELQNICKRQRQLNENLTKQIESLKVFNGLINQKKGGGK